MTWQDCLIIRGSFQCSLHLKSVCPSVFCRSDNYRSWPKSILAIAGQSDSSNYQARTELRSFCVTLNFLMKVNQSQHFYQDPPSRLVREKKQKCGELNYVLLRIRIEKLKLFIRTGCQVTFSSQNKTAWFPVRDKNDHLPLL